MNWPWLPWIIFCLQTVIISVLQTFLYLKLKTYNNKKSKNYILNIKISINIFLKTHRHLKWIQKHQENRSLGDCGDFWVRLDRTGSLAKFVHNIIIVHSLSDYRCSVYLNLRKENKLILFWIVTKLDWHSYWYQTLSTIN